MAAGSERISPTAHATGYFWVRQGLSHAALATAEGRKADRVVRPMLATIRRLGGFSMDALMLARHRGIDAVLEQAIAEGRVGQVIEIAAGLSPRGWSFKRRHPGLAYIETDLPRMVALKQSLLRDGQLLSPGHGVRVLDALADSGADSLAELAASLDPKVGTAVVTEGLMNYLDPATARGVWKRIATVLKRFPQGVYLNDLYLRPQHLNVAAGAFGALLQAFVRGRMHVHFRTAQEVLDTMESCGFSQTSLHSTADIAQTREYAGIRGGDAVMVLEARI